MGTHALPPLDTDVAVETPEHIVFRHRVAGPARRALAHALDLVICYGVVIAVALVVALAVVGGAGLGGAISDSAGLGIGLLLVLLFAAQWIYFAAWEGLLGATPGKMAAGIRVVTTDGRPVGPPQAALRNLLRAADLMPVGYVAGLASMLLSHRFQRLGDRAAATMVIIVPRAPRGFVAPIWPPPQPDEIAAMPADVLFDPEERAALELFLRRRAALPASRANELARLVVGPISRRFAFAVADPVRTLALLYDRAQHAGREEAPRSAKRGARWR